jgi:type I restriction enzyme S subunit
MKPKNSLKRNKMMEKAVQNNKMVAEETRRYNTYKDSGVEWLGEIPEHWNLQKLKSFLTVHGRIGFRGYTVNDLVNKGEGAITISPSNMGESEMLWKKVSYLSWKKYYESPEIIVNEGDLLIVKTASIGKIAYVRELKEKATINPQILILKNIKIDKNYFYYQLLSNVIQHQLQTEKIGSTIYTISENKILNFIATVPPLSEQTKIAQFLDDKTTKIEDAIAIKAQQINLLKERKQILIHKAVTRGLNPNVKLKDSGVEWIGEIPEGWEVKKVKHVTYKIGSGVTPSGGGTTYLDKGIPLLRSQNIFFDKIELDGVAFISDKVHQSMNNSQVFKGDVLLNITGGSIGRCYFVDLDIPLNVNQHVCILRPNKKITTLYLNSLIASPVGQNQIWFHQQGGGREGLNFQALKNFSIPFPPLSEQKEISIYIETASQKIETAISLKQQEIAKLKEYKSSLINSVVTGKVRVV